MTNQTSMDGRAMAASYTSDAAIVPGGLHRRDVLRGAALLALVLGAPGTALAEGSLRATPQQWALVRRVCDLVIPATDTPGAADTGVAEFVVLALEHGLEADGRSDHLAWLESALAGDARTLPDRLAALDQAAFPPGPPPPVPSPWRRLKALILTGYYTSEAGASRELQYELVPGRFDPDLPLHPGDRAWSSDWTAVDFG